MRLLLVPVLFLLTINMVAQSMRFSHLDQKQGLSQNTPDCFLQDSEGFMWIGTQDGLNRYDGYTFTVLRSDPGDTNSLSDNFVLSLAEDSDHNIWVGTRNGICVFIKQENQFYRYRSVHDDPTDFHAQVRSIAAINEGGVVYRTRTNDLVSVRYDAADHRVVATGLVDEQGVYAFAYDAQTGDLAILSKTHISVGLTGNPTVQYSYSTRLRGGVSMILDGEHLYFNDSLNIIHIPIHSKGMSETIYTSDARIVCMTKGPEHSIWIGTPEGLRVINSPLNSPLIEIATENKQDYFGLNGNKTEGIYCTKENTMWVGTVGGINIYDPLQKRFTLLQGTLSNASQDAIWFVMSIGNTTLWANDKGLMSKTYGTSPKWVDIIPKDLHYSAGGFDSKNRLWLGTINQGVLIIDTANGIVDTRFKAYVDFTEASVMDFRSINGNMWIASIGSLCVVDENSLAIHTLRSKHNKVAALGTIYFSAIETAGNKIYVATSKGIAVFNQPDTNATWIVNDPNNQHSLAYNIINDLYANGNDLWIATMGYGLDRMNLADGNISHYTTVQGLANNTIYGIEPGNRNELWLSSNEGLIQFNTISGLSQNFTMRDGLPSNEFVINKHSSNIRAFQICFGSSDGLVEISPVNFQFSMPSIKPVLTEMTVNYEARSHYNTGILQLTPNERNISFEFAAIDFRNQDKISYAYQMEGYDTAWHETSSGNRIANFTNLPYGSYIFKVKYKISGGEWSNVTLEFPLNIQTPFYATTWFLALVIALSIFLVALVVRYISQRKLRKQLNELRVQQKIRTEKERISRDLHDNVGAQLTYVISSLDNLSYNLNKSSSTEKESVKLEQLGEFARGTMDQLRESIWAINSDQINLSELGARWKQYLAQLAETRTDFSGNVKIDGPDLTLKPSIAIEVHRIVQEAINNAFRHSQGNHIRVEIDVENGSPSVTIIDNGLGIKENPEKPGHYGLTNMKERARRINGDLSFLVENGGTSVHLFWPHN